MEVKKLQDELERLVGLQRAAQHDETYGGFSPAERFEYDERRKRISDLRTQIADKVSVESNMTAAADQRREWNKSSETDTPQADARQSYRSREEDSANTLSDSPEAMTQNQSKR